MTRVVAVGASRALSERPHLAFAARLSLLLLGRLPDVRLLEAWLGRLAAGEALSSLAEGALKSREALERTESGAAMTENDLWRCYEEAFGQPLQPAGLPNARRIGLERFVEALIRRDEALNPLPLTPLLYPSGVDPRDADAYAWWMDDLSGLTPLPQPSETPHTAAIFATLILMLQHERPEMVEAAFASIAAQRNRNFEVLLLVSGRSSSALRRCAELFVASNPHAHLLTLRGGDHADVFNTALQVTRSRFVALMGAEDQLAIEALSVMEQAAIAAPDAEVLYSDEDCCDAEGRHHSPHFKVSWDPDAMMTSDRLGALCLFRTDAARAIGGMRKGCQQAGGYDLLLRLTETLSEETIRHVPALLYHRTDRPTSIEQRVAADEYRTAIVSAHLGRRRQAHRILRGEPGAPLRILYPLPAKAPLVSIIIPTKDALHLLRPCVEGILTRTAYPNFEILILDNNSVRPETAAYLKEIDDDEHVRVLAYPHPFNWSALNNFGAQAARGDILVLLNNDTDVIDTDWLDELAGQALRPQIGIVGTKLLYPDGRVQHAGILLQKGEAMHDRRSAPRFDPGYLDRLSSVHRVSAVTGACMAIRKAVFFEIGALEEDLQVTFSDVDLCLRARAHGYGVLWTPYARLYHIELATRGDDDVKPEKRARALMERARMVERWGDAMRIDPFFSNYLAPSEAAQFLAEPLAPFKGHGSELRRPASHRPA